jgi:hypothetical protein
VRLFDTDADPAEKINVAGKYPEIARKVGEYLAGARSDSADWPARWQNRKDDR